MAWLKTELWGDILQNWLLALLIVGLVVLALRLVETLLVRRVRTFARDTETRIDDFVVDLFGCTRPWFLFIVAVYVGSLAVNLETAVANTLGHIVTIALFVQVALWGQGAIAFGVNRYKQERLAEDAGGVTVLSALGLVGKLILWVLILLLILDNVGVQVTSLIAGLGISGIAVALAVQNILGDLFASLSIVLDKPFVIGDAIMVGDFVGTVEKIGLKTTRLRSVSGEQLVFSNTDLLTSRIRNFKSLQERRIVFSFGVLYETAPQKLAQIPDMVREIITAQEQTRFDRTHFIGFGDSALNYEVVYFMLTPDFNLYRDTQQTINLTLLQQFAQAGIEFAYPTQVVYVKREA